LIVAWFIHRHYGVVYPPSLWRAVLGKEKKIKENNSYTRAMSILASGAVRPKEAVDYIGSLEGVDSVVFGASAPGPYGAFFLP